MGVTSPSSGSEIYASCDLQKGNRPLPHRREREIERDLAAARTIYLRWASPKILASSPPSNTTRIMLQYRREKPGLDIFPFSSAAVLCSEPGRAKFIQTCWHPEKKMWVSCCFPRKKRKRKRGILKTRQIYLVSHQHLKLQDNSIDIRLRQLNETNETTHSCLLCWFLWHLLFASCVIVDCFSRSKWSGLLKPFEHGLSEPWISPKLPCFSGFVWGRAPKVCLNGSWPMRDPFVDKDSGLPLNRGQQQTRAQTGLPHPCLWHKETSKTDPGKSSAASYHWSSQPLTKHLCMNQSVY